MTAAAAATLAACIVPALPTRAAPGDTTLVSIALDGKGAGGFSSGMSPDARFVVFSAQSTNVVPGGNAPYALILKDRLLDTTRTVVPGGGNAGYASVSANGRFVAFACYSNLVPGDVNGMTDICATDLQQNRTFLVSVSSSGASANGYSDNPVISDTGRFVVFESNASGLVASDSNAESDIFVRDLRDGMTERVSVSSAEAQANGGSFNCSISADGRFVIFHSYASNLVAGDTNGNSDVFIRDRLLGITERVSVGSDGLQSHSYSYASAGMQRQVTPDGRHVVFTSMDSNLVSGDTNGVFDAFIRDRQLGLTERVSVGAGGDAAQPNQHSFGESISSDGRYVAFQSSASNLVLGDVNGLDDVFVRDRQTNTIVRASVNSAGVQGNGYSMTPMISADGRSVLFNSAATNLVSTDTPPDGAEVYLHELGGVPAGPVSFTVDPARLAIINATVGADTDGSLTFSNTGSAAISIGSLTVRSDPAGRFRVRHACGTSMPTGGACLITVTFHPVEVGSATAQLDVTAGSKTQTVALSGSGIAAQFSVTPRSWSFSPQPVGIASVTRSIEIRNTGRGVLPIKWTGFIGPDSSQFGRRRWCPGQLAPGGVCHVPVWFAPTSPGSKSGWLVISSGPSGTKRYVSLTGTAN